MSVRDPRLVPLADSRRLTVEEGLAVLGTDDILGLLEVVEVRRVKARRDTVFFSVNQHINYTNVCANACAFCRFSRREGEDGAFELSIDDVLGEISPGAAEVHLVGALHPRRAFPHYVAMVRAIRERFPDVGIKAFTAVELAHFAAISKLRVAEVLARLKEAGLTALPGGGAEVFSPRVRALLCPSKISGDEWLEIHAAAHGLGIPTNATLLYGHVETFEERVDHLERVRRLQDETGGFLCFVPLPFQRWEGAQYGGTLPVDDLKMIALCRLFLDNVPHVKAYWVMLGLDTAALALRYGADDLDGTVGGERIAHAAGAETPTAIDGEMIAHLARQAGMTAVSRDSLYRSAGGGAFR